MGDTLSMEQCAASCHAYIGQAGMSNTTATFLWMFGPLGCLLVSAFVGFGIFSGLKALIGGRAKKFRGEENQRKEQEARGWAMRLSGLEVEMGSGGGEGEGGV